MASDLIMLALGETLSERNATIMLVVGLFTIAFLLAIMAFAGFRDLVKFLFPAPALPAYDSSVFSQSPSIIKMLRQRYLPAEDELRAMTVNFNSDAFIDWANSLHGTEVGASAGIDSRLCHGRMQREAYSLLLLTSRHLCENRYFRECGTCCSTMVGAKGIGKT